MKGGSNETVVTLFLVGCIATGGIAYLFRGSEAATGKTEIAEADVFKSRQPSSQSANVRYPEKSPASALPGPDGVKREDICNAEVLHEVTSIEEPSSNMQPGEVYNDVTQFWRNKVTGNTWFCQHGGYCYPSHVIVDGQSVEAIRLKNCTVGATGDDDGEDIYYPVLRP